MKNEGGKMENNEKITVAVVGWQWVVPLERADQGGHFGVNFRGRG
jgi:hypothetical protein